MSRALLTVAAACALAAATRAQSLDPPFRASLRSQFDLAGVTFADIWAEGDFAYVGHSGSNGIEFVDCSDPDAAVRTMTYLVPSPNNAISAQELKSENGLLFIALAGTGPDSVQIVDIRDPGNPVPLTNVSISGFLGSAPHNIFVKDGWLYLCKGSADGIAIVDLRSYDPDDAPAQITTAEYVVNGAGAVHDITVTGDRLWVSDISGSHQVWDVSALGTSAPTFLGSIRGGSVHSSWPTADHAYDVTGDESVGGPLRLYEVLDDGVTAQLVQRDSWVNPLSGPGESADPHNPLVLGNRVYVANNAAGVLCLQIDRTSNTWEKVASYDTSTIVPTAAAGEGCWGVYPYMGEDRIVASDRQTGFYLLDFSALEIVFPAARPETVPAGQAATVDVTIAPLGNAVLDTTSVLLHTSVNGGPAATAPLADLGGGAWRATFPVLDCGDRLDWYVTAEGTDGTEFSRPGTAPAEVYTTYGISTLTTILFDDFETDQGWTTVATDSLTSGAFERGVPVDNGFQPPFDDPDSTGTQCWVTEIGTGGPAGSDDVDNGLVALVSPVMDFAGQDGLISYRRWFFNDDADSAQASPLTVELSNDAGASWTVVESVLLSAGGWREHVLRISDFLPPTSLMQVRFRTGDNPNNSTVEVGIDTFRAESFGFRAAVASRNAGTNPASYAATTMVLGQTFVGTVDNGAAGQLLSALFAFDSPFTLPLANGQTLLCLDLMGSGELFTGGGVTPTSSAGGVDTYSLPIPNDCNLDGFALYTQAIQFGSPPFVLSNAQDLTIGSF